MTTARKPNRLAQALIETADDMRGVGILSAAAHRKITMRHLGSRPDIGAKPITGEEIRFLRERAQLSQAVFARVLNLTVGYVSQLERGAKQPTGPALVCWMLFGGRGFRRFCKRLCI